MYLNPRYEWIDVLRVFRKGDESGAQCTPRGPKVDVMTACGPTAFGTSEKWRAEPALSHEGIVTA